MSKAEDRAKERYWLEPNNIETQEKYAAYVEVYNQAEKDVVEKTLEFLKKRLYKDGYVGIIDLCDDYIKAMKDE
jgi:hypothetical protein